MTDERSVQLHRWFQTPLGQRLIKAEADILHSILPHLFGYHLLQIGGTGHEVLLESSRIMHRCIFHFSIGRCQKSYSYVQGLLDTLPFAQDSIDVVVLPHTLEFEDNPHEILREVERILIPEGHLVILGFNPLSLWGVSRWFLAGRKSAPWCGNFLTLLRLKDWLALLGFELTRQHAFFFALPFSQDHLKNYTALLEKIGSKWAKNLGAIYVLVAKKRVVTLTPLKPKWQPTKPLLPEVISSPFKKENGCQKKIS